MRNKVRNLFLFSVLAAYAVIITIIFLLVKEPTLSNANFIAAMCCTFIPNVALLFVIYVRAKKQEKSDVITYSAIFRSFGITNAITLVIGVAVALINVVIVTVIVELVALVAYVILWARFLLVVDIIKHNDAVRQEKIDFKRELYQTVSSYVGLTQNEKVIKKLNALSDSFRFCDPMSHDSLREEEAEIYVSVKELQDLVESGEEAEILAAISKIEVKLKIRNDKCLRLK